MKVICGKEELLRGTQIVQSVISPRSTLPVLSNFLFETEGQQIKMSSTDLEVGVTCFIKAEVVKEGSITIPAKRFSDIVRELPGDGSIEIKCDDNNQINIRCGKSHFVLMGLPKTDYPILPTFPEENQFNINRPAFKSMLRRTSFAVSTDETRYVLNGVFLLVEEGKLKLVATDGRRLAYIAASPLVPLILLAKMARKVITKKDYAVKFVLSLPFTLLFTVCWSWGEFLGYLLGTRGATRHPMREAL